MEIKAQGFTLRGWKEADVIELKRNADNADDHQAHFAYSSDIAQQAIRFDIFVFLYLNFIY